MLLAKKPYTPALSNTPGRYKVQAGTRFARNSKIYIAMKQICTAGPRSLQFIFSNQMHSDIFHILKMHHPAVCRTCYPDITVLQRQSAAIARRLPHPALCRQLIREWGFLRNFQPFRPRGLGGRALGQRRRGHGTKHHGRSQQHAHKLFELFHTFLSFTGFWPRLPPV